MIPVPPFADNVEARLFLRELSLHLASLDRDRVTLPTFVMLTVLDGLHGGTYRGRHEDFPLPLPASILRIALLSRFPMPWTPPGLHAALEAGDDWSRSVPSTAGVFERGSDPRITATRTADGTWTRTHTERGSTRVTHSGLSDEQYVALLLEDERGNPFPYGWRWEDTPDLDEVLRGAAAARDQWESGPGRLPYLTRWIDGRDNVLAGRQPEP
jgi:hypothetical protein